jgi:hypothetical protein
MDRVHPMNHREPPHPSAGVRRALMCLAALLWAAVAPQRLDAITRRSVITFVRSVEASPYLPINGAPPLRFAEAPAPPKALEVNASNASGTLPLTQEAADFVPPDTALPQGATSPALTEALAGGGGTSEASSATPAAKSPAPILRDDVRPTVRAEDFLPYFQIPGSARNPGDVTFMVPGITTPPAPGSLPPSSATYTPTPQ